ncbi:Npt1/Npt2 family nucleotide transporter [Paenibacillus sp. LHD-117]|uniref:Npt1/Npt2 family nucleotide transporter n=1 Tax=Paenibacillus sp. LHD-117 TaxID=3071412 RepID=UPI0027E0A2FB|nr:Npt1/Npt2 family nucleotide transporter [Paenibacillus sp. LHD-117]MDQ6423024.1 Npt1/Npt2 family nucleotide transporter [Paenibacillus sp. LHD-117]
MNGFLRAVGARPEDQRKLLLMAPVFFVCGIAEMLNYNSFMTLFNQRFGSEYLPYVYAAEAFVLPLEAWLLSWLAAKLPKPKLMRVMYGLMIGIVGANAAILLALQGFGMDARWYYPVLFIASNFVVRQQTLLLWSLAIDLCSTQQAKRLMPVFVGSATLGGATAGLLAQLISLAFGPVAIYAAGCLLLLLVWRRYRKVIDDYLVPISLRLEAARDELEVGAGTVFKQAMRSPFLLMVILLMTLMPALYFLMEYEFLNVARTAYDSEQSFSQFFGMITMILFVLAFLLQLVSGKLMEKLGASRMLTIIAGVYVLSFAGAVAFAGGTAALPMISLGYMLLYLLLYYSAEPSYQLFFKTLPLAQRDSYRYAAQGIAASAGILLGAGMQFLHSGFGFSWLLLSLIGLAGSALLLALAWYGRRLYMRELVHSVGSMSAADIEESIEEISLNPAAMAEVRRMLGHPSDSAREIAIQLVGKVKDPKDLPALLGLLEDANDRIRVAAIRAMTLEKADLQTMAKIARFLEEPDDALRTEGVRAIARMKQLEEQAFFFLRQKLLDRHPSVVAEAVKAMYSLGREQSYEACKEVIDRILREGGEASVYMCGAIAELRLTAFIPAIMKLADDPHPAARVSAIRALGQLGSVALIPLLLARLPLMDEEMLTASTKAFVDIGAPSVEPLQASLPKASPKLWSSAVIALSELLGEEDIRGALAQEAISRLAELGKAADYGAALRAYGEEELAMLADMRWREVRAFVFRGLWSMLAKLTDERAVDVIRAGVTHAEEEYRSNALEVLSEGFGDRRISQAMVVSLEQESSSLPMLEPEQARTLLETALQGTDDWWKEMASEALTASKGGMAVTNEGLMMSRLNKVVFLKQVPYFSDLSLEELGLIAGVAEEQTISDEDALLKRGEAHPAMYVIVEGNVELTSVSAAGWEGTIGVLGSGDVCGVTSALDGSPSTVTAQSLLGDARVLKLSGDDVSRLVRLYPEIGIGLLRASFARIRLLEEMMMRIDS